MTNRHLATGPTIMNSNDSSDPLPRAHEGERAGRGVTHSEAVLVNGVGLIVEHEAPEPEPVVHLAPKMSKRTRARLRRLRRELSAEFGESWNVSRGANNGA